MVYVRAVSDLPSAAPLLIPVNHCIQKKPKLIIIKQYGKHLVSLQSI